MLISLLLLAALALAFANGANDNFKVTATLYGSGNLAYGPARRLATVSQIFGSLASVAWAESLLRTFGGRGWYRRLWLRIRPSSSRSVPPRRRRFCSLGV